MRVGFRRIGEMEERKEGEEKMRNFGLGWNTLEGKYMPHGKSWLISISVH